MGEITSLPQPQHTRLLESLHIPDNAAGKRIGTLILLGQGPVQDARTKVKMESLEKALGVESVYRPEANSWMKMIARAGATLYKTGEVDTIIPSGRATGGEVVIGGEKVAPSEAVLMEKIIQSLTKGQEGSPNIQVETEARNTIWNFIHSANMLSEDIDPSNVTVVCAHFHKPRIKVLASLFGFDPERVISAEEVLTASSKLAVEGPRAPEFNLEKFDRQASMVSLLRVRLGLGNEGDDRAYFDRKKTRARGLLETLSAGREGADISSLVIEEQKSAADRMMDERRWVRGLAMEHQYVVPLLGGLKSDARLAQALSKFPKDMLKDQYDIDMNTMSMSDVREKLDPTRWSWQVVKEEWKNESYPQEVIDRLQALGVSREDRDRLSNAHIPEIQLVGTSQ